MENQETEFSTIRYKVTYPQDPNYDYDSRMIRLNLDDEREKSIMTGQGFLITSMQSTLKKDLKSPTSIYSAKFGQTLQDLNPFGDRYRCSCGNIKQKFNAGTLCPRCHTLVEYVDDNFNYFGWMVLKNYYTIHPNLYKALSSYIGRKIFENIIRPVDEKDENGFSKKIEPPKNEPFFGIGIMELKDRIKEVLDYYYKPSKKDKYDVLIENIGNIFTHSIPVK